MKAQNLEDVCILVELGRLTHLVWVDADAVMVGAINNLVRRGGRPIGLLGVRCAGLDYEVQLKPFKEFAVTTPNVDKYFQNLLQNFSLEHGGFPASLCN
jgi:hypothetical protein